MPSNATVSIGRKRKRASPTFDPRIASAFGHVARQLRSSQGLAQDEFANAAGVDRSYYGKLERGERQPSLGMLLKIATALNRPGAELVALTEAQLVKTSD